MSDPEIENVIEEGAISSVPRVGTSDGSSLLSSTIQFLQQEPQLSLLCGGLAGALSRTAVSPVERVKVLYQVQGPTNSYTKGTLRTVYQIWKEEGYKGLFRGNGINCIRIFPYSAVQYSVYMQLKAWYQKGSDLPESENLPAFEKLVAGGIAGFASVLVTYPMDLVKTRLSIQTATSLKNLNDSTAVIRQKPLGMFGSLKDIYKNEGGFRALYRGLMPTSCGVAPYVGLNFAIYESMKEAIDEKYRSNPIVILTMGALSGGIAQTMVYPFDILRRRFQVATLKGGKMGFQYKSTWDALRTIVVKEGVKGLFRGWQANMWKIMPSMAVQWASYDLIKEFLKGM